MCGVTRLDGHSLKTALSPVRSLYEVPDDDLVGEVLIPAMTAATDVRVGSGFFSSESLAQIAPGLAAFVNAGQQPMQLLVSPQISVEDREAIDVGLREPAKVIEQTVQRILDDATLSTSALVQHTLACLSYLIAADRLELRFVLMRHGMYHKKIWLFDGDSGWCAVHGSSNATIPGLLVNGEQMTVDRPWMDGPSVQARVSDLANRWQRQWDNDNPHSLTVTAPQGLRFAGPRDPAAAPPTVEDFWAAWRADFDAGTSPPLPPNLRSAPHQLAIPEGMQWRIGKYAHQGRAVDALLGADGRGVLAIATGGGKTKAALISATQLQNRNPGSVLVVILVPSSPLLKQWTAEVQDFNVTALQPSALSPEPRRTKLEELQASLSTRQRRTEVIVCSNQLFNQTDSPIRALLDRLPADVHTVLIGDEMHNLGAPGFINHVPERFDSRIGLSATPIRQYDPDGTNRLFDYFGPPVFEFSLEDAIRAGCLTKYSYHLHPVQLSDEEMDKYAELTEQLRRAGFGRDDDGQTVDLSARIEALLRQRRAVLEQTASKISRLRDLLEQTGPRTIARTLIYTSAKPPVLDNGRQIDEVTALLADLGVISHQLTNAETSTGDATKLLDAFGEADYQVLVAMKVLDEGVDIPQTDTAYLMASSTVRREWIQRRGRILRQYPGKQQAALHDFFVVPPDPSTNHGKAVLRGEIARAEEFTALADNEWDSDGPRSILSEYEDALRKGAAP